VAAWDDATNNKWLVSGKGALIMNPPSAWAVAKRDAPQVAEQCWTHGFPIGPKGRFAPFGPFFWSLWNFSKNKEAAKSLLVYLSQPSSVEKMVNASGGYDLPAFENLTTLKVWAEEGPPKGTLYHYPNPHNHQVLSIAAASVVAKVTRDAIMAAEAEHFPAYGFESNRGYPAPVHKCALAAYGPSAIHRRSWIFMENLPWSGIHRDERADTNGSLRLFTV